jgi:tartrate dehydratase beta subunit/fumarate hydratase class I family protein
LEAGNLRQALEGILDYVGLGWEVMDVIEVEDYIPAGVGMDYNSSSTIS